MRERIKKMRDIATTSPIVIGLEKLRIAADTLEEARNLPRVTYRSMLHANYYRRLPIAIPDYDMICGTGASHTNGVELDYEMGVWSKAELDHLFEETGDMYYIRSGGSESRAGSSEGQAQCTGQKLPCLRLSCRTDLG